MGLLLYFLIVVLACYRPKSKKIAVAAAVFMVILFGLNTASGDYTMYKWIYEELYTWKGVGLLGAHEPGFELLMIICKTLGISYQGFRVVIGIICAVLTYLTACKLTAYPAVAMVVFILNPFAGFVSGIRMGLASAIIMYALSYLICAKEKPILKYVIGILVATMFHYSSIAYLFLVVVKIKIPTRKMLVICAVFAGVVTFAVHGSTLLYDVLDLLTDNKKILQWFDLNNLGMERMSIRGKLYVIGLLTYNVIMSGLAQYRMERDHLSGDYEKTSYFSRRVCIVLVAFLPLFFINGTFLRYISEVQLLLICACVEASSYVRNRKPAGLEKVLDPIVMLAFISVFTLLVDNKSVMQYTDYHCLTPFVENLLFSLAG